MPWFIYSIIHACKAGYEGALIWVAQPVNAILLILTLSAALYHMRLGMQVVIEDYIAKSGTRQALSDPEYVCSHRPGSSDDFVGAKNLVHGGRLRRDRGRGKR